MKDNERYADDFVTILSGLITRQMGSSYSDIPTLTMKSTPIRSHPMRKVENKLISKFDGPILKYLLKTSTGRRMDLKCVIGILRHGDRTPKQKMKFNVQNDEWTKLYNKYVKYPGANLKMRKPTQLKEVLDASKYILEDLEKQNGNKKLIKQYSQVKAVLEMHGKFSGINRKVQIKPLDKTLKSFKLITKWGGELTKAGQVAASMLGKSYRDSIYPKEDEGILLRLHSTYKHDMKIYASEEGRVQMTAAAFTQGLLSLEGALPPILASMVKSAHTDGLLNDESIEQKSYLNDVKVSLHKGLKNDQELTDNLIEKYYNTTNSKFKENLIKIGNPKEICKEILFQITEIIKHLEENRFVDGVEDEGINLELTVTTEQNNCKNSGKRTKNSKSTSVSSWVLDFGGRGECDQ